MLKRVVSAVVGVACMLSMTSAFAWSYDTTRTEYYSADQIKVVSTVTGAATETATYLVYNKEKASAEDIQSGDDIVYVDQYKFTEAGSYEFTYLTSKVNIGSKIRVGSSAASAVGPTAVPGISYPVTVTSGEETWKTLGWTDGVENAWVKVPYDTTESIITAVTFNGSALDKNYWFTAVDALWIGEQVWKTSQQNTIEVTATEVAAASATAISVAYFASEEQAVDGYSEPSVVVVGQVKGNSADFGIILGKTEADLQACFAAMQTEGASVDENGAFVHTENASVLPSLGKNSEGKFAIRVYDEGFTAETALYAAVYYKDGEGAYVLSDNYVTLTVSE